ncbi:hypothetical protein L5H80_07840, partial [Enterococcus faecium]|nr:hypothetical protein [Enterococcus faecium]
QEAHIVFTLSKVGTKRYSVEQLFEALTATKLKASLGVEKEQMVIRLTIPNQMEEAVWLQEIQKFVKALREQKYLSA